MANNIKNLYTRLRRKSSSQSSAFIFPKTDPLVDGEDCLHDCEDCTVHLPASFKIDESDTLYGHVNAFSTHLIVATGKTDWVRDVADEKGSVMEAVGKGNVQPTNGKLMLSASNMPIPQPTSPTADPTATTVLLLPAFTYIDAVTPAAVPALITQHINPGPTNTTPLPLPRLQEQPAPPLPTAHDLASRPCPHRYLILLCSQRTRDARCGQSAPLLKREFERHLRPLGLYRDAADERPGGAAVLFISHVGGHKYSANCFVYRKAGAPGTLVAPAAADDDDAAVPNGDGAAAHANGAAKAPNGAGVNGLANGVAAGALVDAQAAQCIWLARVRPEDCENIVRYTVLQGKVVKPERQLRGGFDRARGLVSW